MSIHDGISDFDGRREPMRALRDLINLCEQTFPLENGGREEQEIIAQAQNGFTTLRKLFGDNRLAEDVAHGPMVEPPLPLPDQPDLHPGCKKVRDVVIALLKLPMHADFQVDDGAEFRDFTIEHVVRETAPGDAQLVVIKPE
jgi:hypothetical protein